MMKCCLCARLYLARHHPPAPFLENKTREGKKEKESKIDINVQNLHDGIAQMQSFHVALTINCDHTVKGKRGRERGGGGERNEGEMERQTERERETSFTTYLHYDIAQMPTQNCTKSAVFLLCAHHQS